MSATFRATVALIAQRAQAILPASTNGRVEGAIRLVLAHDVEPQADGTILVGSCSDPLKTYRLQGSTCECADFPRAPEGWCRHRIAAGIAKRVGQELARSTPVEREVEMPADFEAWGDNDHEGEAVEPPPTPAPQPLPEAPASVNVRVQIGGRECQLTLRDHDEARLLVRLEEVLQRYPLPQPPAPVLSPPVVPAEEPRWCPKHGAKMTLNHKDGRSWWSHRHEGQWCKGR